ncbi:hypothetical protein RB9197 [Rhodopirellula baltica SH 1]|uniref:Uncharacterized protein n=1 Tax=Rhodopirellula baltica (strain DSM 10527 / NCIMB 13988 / SH1) TaxID=243090 RepID=Q7ULY4_RHOBA|nr:hypothetical protein RB9197 [Rhodopirellula baltica SH 1]
MVIGRWIRPVKRSLQGDHASLLPKHRRGCQVRPGLRCRTG